MVQKAGKAEPRAAKVQKEEMMAEVRDFRFRFHSSIRVFLLDTRVMQKLLKNYSPFASLFVTECFQDIAFSDNRVVVAYSLRVIHSFY